MSAINHLSPRYQIDSPSPADNDVGSHSLLNNNPTGNQSKQPALAFEEEPVNMTYHDTPASTSNIESRHIQHRETLHYVFKKPKLPQSYIKDDLHDTNGPGLEMRSTNDLEGVRNAGHSMNHHAIASQEHKAKEREWLNLFIDLIWAGIVSNISEVFVGRAFEAAPGSWSLSYLQYLILFLTAWKMWNDIREFLDDFFNKDFLQTWFILWILVLGLLFGNNASYFSEHGRSNIIVWIYLASKGSFIAIRTFYCIFLPELRPELKVSAVMIVVPAGLWIGSIWLPWPRKATLVLPAIVWETFNRSILSIPILQRSLGFVPRKSSDGDHYVERLQAFFVIILGEGIAQLIQGSPLGYGITLQSASGVLNLVLYHALYWLLFTGDHSRLFIPAVHLSRHKAVLFKLLYVILFGSLLLLDSSLGFIIKNSTPTPQADPEVEARAESEPEITDIAFSLHQARWTASGALTVVLICMTWTTLLNKSLDSRGSHLVNNRYLRMGMRAVVAVVALCLPIKRDLRHGLFVGVIVLLLQMTIWWEYVAGLEPGGKLVEPR